jgi:hypothetical protein
MQRVKCGDDVGQDASRKMETCHLDPKTTMYSTETLPVS